MGLGVFAPMLERVQEPRVETRQSSQVLGDYLIGLLIDEAEVGVLVAEVQSGCHLRLLFASIHGGPILLSGRLEPVEHLQTLRVLRRGSAFSSHLPKIPCPRYES